nr:PREDICTED: uncharacterized protein LOC108953793 [Musa acuminata subsp. malaccensis]
MASDKRFVRAQNQQLSPLAGRIDLSSLSQVVVFEDRVTEVVTDEDLESRLPLRRLGFGHRAPRPRLRGKSSELPRGPPPFARPRCLSATYGPVVTLFVGHKPAVYIVDRHVARQALVEKASQFFDRPPPIGATCICSSGGRIISSAAHGALWRLLRRNLTSGILLPSRIRSCSRARERALASLIESLKADADSGDGIVMVYDHIRHAFLRLLILMCFDDALSEKAVRNIMRIQRGRRHGGRPLHIRHVATSGDGVPVEEMERISGDSPRARRRHVSTSSTSWPICCGSSSGSPTWTMRRSTCRRSWCSWW